MDDVARQEEDVRENEENNILKGHPQKEPPRCVHAGVLYLHAESLLFHAWLSISILHTVDVLAERHGSLG